MSIIIAQIATAILYLGISVVASVLIDKWIKHGHIVNLLLPVVLCAFFAGCRGTIGTDSLMYMTEYETIGSIQRWVDFEPGFYVIVWILKRLRLSSWWLLFTYNLLTMLFSFLAIRRIHNATPFNTFIAVFVLMLNVYFHSWNMMRQSLAIGLCMYALSLYLTRRKCIGMCVIGLAALFHYSAIICFVFPIADFLFRRKLAKPILWILSFFMLFAIINHNTLGEIVYKITGSAYWAMYFYRDVGVRNSLVTYFIKCLPYMIVGYLAWPHYKVNYNLKVLCSFMILGYIFSAIGSLNNTGIQRLGYYFTYLNCFVMGFATKHRLPLFNKVYISSKDVNKLICMFALVLFIFNYFVKGYSNIAIYSWFL